VNPGWEVYFRGIPSYEVTITQSILDNLKDRPRAASDFEGGTPSVSVGDVILFGEDIGYDITNPRWCSLGYWPPGPGCPKNYTNPKTFPLEPAPEVSSGIFNNNTY
jgi:hypothetical protein